MMDIEAVAEATGRPVKDLTDELSSATLQDKMQSQAEEITRLREALQQYACTCSPGYCEVGNRDLLDCGHNAREALSKNTA